MKPDLTDGKKCAVFSIVFLLLYDQEALCTDSFGALLFWLIGSGGVIIVKPWGLWMYRLKFFEISDF